MALEKRDFPTKSSNVDTYDNNTEHFYGAKILC